MLLPDMSTTLLTLHTEKNMTHHLHIFRVNMIITDFKGWPWNFCFPFSPLFGRPPYICPVNHMQFIVPNFSAQLSYYI